MPFTFKKNLHTHSPFSIPLITLLIFSLLTQSLLILFSITNTPIPLPRSLSNSLKSQLANYNLSLQYSSAKFHLHNLSISLEDIHLFNNNISSPILSCQSLLLKPNLSSILFSKKFFPKSLHASHLTFFCPAPRSPSSLNHPILSNVLLSLSFKNNLLSIKEFSGLINNTTPLLVSGSISPSSLLSLHTPIQDPTPTYGPQLSLIRRYYDLIQSLTHYANYLNDFSNPSIHLLASPNQLILSLLADSFKNPSIPLSAKSPRLSTTISLSNSPSKSYPISIQAAQLLLHSSIHLFHPHISAQIPSSLSPPDHIHFYAHSLSLFNYSLPHPISGSLSPSSSSIHTSLSLLSPESALSFNINSSTQAPYPTHIHSSGTLSSDLLPLPSNLYPNLSYTLDFLASASLSFPNNSPSLSNLNIFVPSGQALAQDSPFNSLSLSASLNPLSNLLHISNIHLLGPSNSISGQFSLNTLSKDYRLSLHGHIQPHLVDPINQLWWDSLRQSIQLLSPLNPSADLDIKGNSTSPLSPTTFGSFSFKNFSYNNVPFQHCSFTVKANPLQISLLNLNALHSNNSALNASLSWLYQNPSDTQSYRLSINARSSLPFQDLLSIINDKELSKNFPPSVSQAPTPLISASGYLQDNSNNLLIECSHPSQLLVYTFPITNLQFKAHYLHQSVSIPSITFNFANGSGHASASISSPSDNSFFKSNQIFVTLQNADLPTSLSYLPLPSSPSSPKSPKSYSPLPKKGSYNLSLLLSTPDLSNIDAFSASGSISIFNADLGKIKLFGFLPKIIALPPLNLARFDLSQAESSFSLQNSSLSFPDLILTGPSISIKGNGTYSLSSHQINALFNISSITPKIPILGHALLLLNPITSSICVKVQGLLTNPIYSIQLSPKNILPKKSPK